MTPMIQEYLNEQLIQTTDDSHVEKLKKICTDLAKKISKDKEKILRYSLVAVDPEIPADNLEVVEVKNLIVESWQTFVPNSKDTALTIIRAVVLEVLQILSKELDNALIIWFSNKDRLKYLKLGRDKSIINNFILELGNRIEAQASEQWSFSPSEGEIEVPKIIAAVIDIAELTPHVQPNAVNATGVADVFNKALKKQVNELKDSQRSFMQLNVLMHMRTHLIWWKEARYSTLLRGSYKGLNEGSLEIVLAFDFSAFIPEIYPVSVDFFLVETHNDWTNRSQVKIKISDFIKSIEKEKEVLKTIIPEYTAAGRIPFIRFLQGLIHGKFNAMQFKDSVGIQDTTEITYKDLILWLFHDLQAIKHTI
jgi:hypothetical protein